MNIISCDQVTFLVNGPGSSLGLQEARGRTKLTSTGHLLPTLTELSSSCELEPVT